MKKEIWNYLNQEIKTDPEDVKEKLRAYVWLFEKLSTIGMVAGVFLFFINKSGYTTSLSRDEFRMMEDLASPYISFYLFFFSALLYIATRLSEQNKQKFHIPKVPKRVFLSIVSITIFIIIALVLQNVFFSPPPPVIP